MKYSVVVLCGALAFAASAIVADADPQQDFTSTLGIQGKELNTQSARELYTRPPGEPVLELTPLAGPQLPPAPPALSRPEIPAAFMGCWEGNPDRFDSVVSSPGTVTVGEPGRIIFCYHPNAIEVPLAEISFRASEWAKNVASHLGLGLTWVKVDQPRIATEVYAVNSYQIHARTLIPLEITDHMLFLSFTPYEEDLHDEELVSLRAADALLVQARQELSLGPMHSVRSWRAEFHRVPHP